MKKFKVGDFVYESFELKQVGEVDSYGRVQVTKDGMFSRSGDLHPVTFPLSLKNKSISEKVKKDCDKFKGANSYPKIVNRFIEMWVKLCETSNDEEYGAAIDLYNNEYRKITYEFRNEIDFYEPNVISESDCEIKSSLPEYKYPPQPPAPPVGLCYREGEMPKKLNDYDRLYNEYRERYDGHPKYSYSHFVNVLGKVHAHREFTRPRLKWWQEAKQWLFK